MTIRGKRWWLLALLMAAAIVAIIRRPSPPEPTYGGKTFSAWFKEAETMTYSDENAPCVTAIRAMGPEAVPLLTARVRRGSFWWDEFWWRRYQNLPPSLRHYFSPPDFPTLKQRTAAVVLYETHLSARAVAPDLIAGYDRAYLKQYHLPGMGRVDWTAQLAHPPPVLLSGGMGHQPSSDLRQWILMTLARDGGDDPEIIPLLLASVHEPSANMRGNVPSFLRSSNTNLAFAIRAAQPALVIALADPAAEVRATAADLLRLNAPDHPEIAPPLIKLLSDPDPAVNKNAFECLQRTRMELDSYLPAFDRLYTNENSAMRAQAVELLFHAAGGFKELPRGLNHSLDSTNVLVRAGAVEALGDFGPRFAVAAPKLRELTNESVEPDERVRRAAVEALNKIVPVVTAQ